MTANIRLLPHHQSTILDRYAKFRRGEISTEDSERSGRPNGVVADVNIKKTHKTILSELKLKLNERAGTLEISTEHIQDVYQSRVLRKLYAKRLPRELTFDQTQRQVDDAEQCLEFKCNKPEFLCPPYSPDLELTPEHQPINLPV